MEVVMYLYASSGGTAFPEDKARHCDRSWESWERYNRILYISRNLRSVIIDYSMVESVVWMRGCVRYGGALTDVP